ncbi:hypothetical protein TL16_g06457 [Triparma laevis f. inornata]|uniref:SCP2 domain-containing protein n=2 Tax=Triparma laevis TaxID=1534972 RepID=A0A9W7C135_9STRA|nr:hypothetical protein TL16_g06457 [Triparma laevis f. inornata]GMI00303.1 hypothetical protein TrLO_g11354 [Triparma laevis f. longispina]
MAQQLTTEEIFQHIEETVKSTPGLKKKFPGILVLKVSDSESSLTIDVPKLTTSRTPHPKPNLTITLSSSILLKIFNGTLKPQAAFMKKLIKIEGRLGLAMKFQGIVGEVRKRLKSRL